MIQNNPVLTRTLMTKSTAANTSALMARLTGQLGKLSLVTTARVPTSSSGPCRGSPVCKMLCSRLALFRVQSPKMLSPGRCNMAFLRGNPGGPGRPKGSRNKLAESFIDALHKDFLVHGAEAIEAARAESPLGYVRLVASLLPAKIEVGTGGGSVSDAELVAIIRGAVVGDDGRGDIEPVEGSVH